jgi:hypothetical protein
MFVPQKYFIFPKKEMIKKTTFLIGIALIIILSWSMRNYLKHDIFVTATIGVHTTKEYLAAAIITRVDPHTNIWQIRKHWKEQEFLEYGPNISVRNEYENDVSIILKTIASYPLSTLRTYLSLVFKNMLAPESLHIVQLPKNRGFCEALAVIMSGSIFGLIIMLISLAGIVMIFRSSLNIGVILLIALGVYFGLLSGLTFWQGSRIFFPAQLLWAFLVAYVFERVILNINHYLYRR